METILTCSEMKLLDQHTINDIGVPSAVLMERAALSVAKEVMNLFPGDHKSENRSILCVCGSGNNGGDGVAVARLLHNAGYNAYIYMAGNHSHYTEETARQVSIAEAYKVPFLDEGCLDLSFDIIVDALFGIGLARKVEGKYAGYIERINRNNAVKVAVDIPSGISGDTGQVMGSAVKCSLTVTFAFRKAGHILYPGRTYCGRTICSDIGIYENSRTHDTKISDRACTHDIRMNDSTRTREIGMSDSAGTNEIGMSDSACTHDIRINDSACTHDIKINDSGCTHEIGINDSICANGMYSFEPEDLAAVLNRDADGNKGTFGKVLAVTGSSGMCGAAYLCASGALRSGAGMVMIRTDAENRIPLQMLLPEAMLSCADSSDGLKRIGEWADVFACGCGLGQSGEAEQKVLWCLEECHKTGKPLVLDADALNILSKHPEWYKYLGAHTVLTPHVGEMGRISGFTIEEIKSDPVKTAVSFAKKTGAVVVQKDACTITASPDGQIFLNRSGNSGMGTAGSGDALCGIIAGLLAQNHKAVTYNGAQTGNESSDKKKNTAAENTGYITAKKTVYTATGKTVYTTTVKSAYIAAAGVYLHGLAGDEAALQNGQAGMKAGDIVEALKAVLRG